VIVQRTPGGDITLGLLPAALADLLGRAEAPVPRRELLSRALELGAEPGENESIVDSMLADGLITLAVGDE
jgi:hypothetical protein